MNTTRNLAPPSPQFSSDVAFSGYLQSVPRRSNSAAVGEFSIPRVQRNLPRLLWIGDAMVPTGFATVTHSLLDHLWKDWNVLVSGINSTEPVEMPHYSVVPAQRKEDMWGIDSFEDLCREFEPDLVVINNDWWNVAKFLECSVNVPIVAYMPVDGANMDPGDVSVLNRLAAAVWYTDFGWREAQSAGYTGERHVVPHGTDLPEKSSVSRAEARKLLDLEIPDGAFLVGNVNRNQPRKRIDLTIDYFASWIHEHHVDDAWLCLHCSHSEDGWDLRRLAGYHGISDRVVFTDGDGTIGSVPEETLDLIYRSFDVQVSTTSGEGWGLTTMEGMSRGIPQIVPDWAALGEWTKGGVECIPCGTRLAHPMINTIGALPDREPFVAALDRIYRNPASRSSSGRNAKRCVSGKQFRWESVALEIDGILRRASARDRDSHSLRRAS